MKIEKNEKNEKNEKIEKNGKIEKIEKNEKIEKIEKNGKNEKLKMHKSVVNLIAQSEYDESEYVDEDEVGDEDEYEDEDEDEDEEEYIPDSLFEFSVDEMIDLGIDLFKKIVEKAIAKGSSPGVHPDDYMELPYEYKQVLIDAYRYLVIKDLEKGLVDEAKIYIKVYDLYQHVKDDVVNFVEDLFMRGEYEKLLNVVETLEIKDEVDKSILVESVKQLFDKKKYFMAKYYIKELGLDDEFFGVVDEIVHRLLEDKNYFDLLWHIAREGLQEKYKDLAIEAIKKLSEDPDEGPGIALHFIDKCGYGDEMKDLVIDLINKLIRMGDEDSLDYAFTYIKVFDLYPEHKDLVIDGIQAYIDRRLYTDARAYIKKYSLEGEFKYFVERYDAGLLRDR